MRRYGCCCSPANTNHDWQFTSATVQRVLKNTGRFKVNVTEAPSEALAAASLDEKFDVFVVDYNGPRWSKEAEQNFSAAVRAGVGVVILHAANNTFEGWRDYELMCALTWRDGSGQSSVRPLTTTINAPDHPITQGQQPAAGSLR